MQNKEAEAKEELKRRAKQLEMQRREQQRRAATTGGGSTGYGGYSPVSQRFDAPESTPAPARIATSSPAPSRAPAFKSSGMKLGSKKTKQAELLDALGGDVLLTATPDTSAPPTPSAAVTSPVITQKVTGRGSLPEITQET